MKLNHRLQHAEAASPEVLREGGSDEPQPRGARIHGNHPIDHNEAATRFIAAPEHESTHDARLWDLRSKRDQEMHGIPEWEDLRQRASDIKEHTLAHLADHLEQFVAAAEANGVHVHWTRDAEEHNEIVAGILQSHDADSLIKSKSMLTEECNMRDYLTERHIEVTETDLGERIQQLDDEMPSHIVVPATHKLRTDVAKVFAEHLDTDPHNDDPNYLAEQQREKTRPIILSAGAGMTGANYAVAETGTVVVCTNEGNADLSANVPPLHIVSIGIEKIIPRMADLGVFIRLLSRSALGSPITQYTSHFTRPREGSEMHYVLVDNGRSERLGEDEFWTSLKCIRCSACMNTCPVYRRSGGLSYGSTYAGPIGLILDPTLNRRRYSSLPYASTLNASCTNVCPVKINIHEQILEWRKVMAAEKEPMLVERMAMTAAGVLLSHPKAYREAIATADRALRVLPQFAVDMPLNPWATSGRATPSAPRETFHQWYERTNGGRDEPLPGQDGTTTAAEPAARDQEADAHDA